MQAIGLLVDTIADDERGREILELFVESAQTKLSQDFGLLRDNIWGSLAAAAQRNDVGSTSHVPRRGRPRKWTSLEDTRLDAWMNEGLDAPEIATILGRTVPDVEKHIDALRGARLTKLRSVPRV